MILSRETDKDGVVYSIEKQQLPLKGHISKLFPYKMVIFATYVSEDYPDTYDDSGFIFETDANPVFVCPTDHFNLLIQYPGFEEFVFSSIEEMLEKFPTLEIASEAVNKRRIEKEGYIFSLGPYCSEVAFDTGTPVKVLALFGGKDLSGISNKYNLPLYK
ncbi:MAG: hypothetical protein JSV92_02890 [archaeon]|nr:MAG: hypothetical protein JSV92_02890 [archaeon]